MADDIPNRISKSLNLHNTHVPSDDLQGYVLYELEIIFNSHGKTLADYGLPSPPITLLENLRNRMLMEEKNYDRCSLAEETAISVLKLNIEQRKVYDLIMESSSCARQELMFIYGHSGTGKTFMWKSIIASLRSQGKIVLAFASSGIASLLLPSGRTAHSRFKLPLDLTDESICHIKKSVMANLLKQTNLIIWDEAPMNDRLCFETLDRTLRDMLDSPNLFFGGKSVILGGDFRQTLPIKQGGSKKEIISSSIANSHLWPEFKVCILKEKMCLSGHDLTVDDRHAISEFASWLLNIGDGKNGYEIEDGDTSWVNIPNRYCITDSDTNLTELVAFIYDQQTLNTPTVEQLQTKAIICPRNDTADIINTHVLSMLQSHTVTYISSDEAIPIGND